MSLRFAILWLLIFEAIAFVKADIPIEYAKLIEQESKRTGVPAWILTGIFYVESTNGKNNIGDDGHSLGPMQHFDKYYIERCNKWGTYNPFYFPDAIRISANILRENYSILKDWTLTIASYRQGVPGVLKNGPDMDYVKKVIMGEP
jgi:hypothetical protein